MAETLLQKAQRLGIQPAGEAKPVKGESILEKAQRLGIKPAAQQITEEPTKPGFIQKATETYKNTSLDIQKGVIKKAGSTLFNLGKLGEKALRSTVGKYVVEPITGKPLPAPTYGEEPEMLKPKGTAQKAGYIAGTIGEFMLPAGKVAKAESMIDTLITGSSLLPTFGRVAAKSAVSGLVSGGVRLAQTASTEEAKKTGLVTGALRGVTGAAGEAMKYFKWPQKMYSRIFKNTRTDIKDALESGAFKDLKQNDPTKYELLKSRGIITEAKDGSINVNQTLAEEAIEKGLTGNLEEMAKRVIVNTADAELAAQDAAAAYKTLIKVEPQYVNTLKGVVEQYKDIGFGEKSKAAQEILNKIVGGKTDATNMLTLRRLLDSLTRRSTFVETNLPSLSQNNLNTLANSARAKLANIPGFEKIMSDYRFNLEAVDSLADAATREGNRQVLGSLEKLWLGGGVITNNPQVGITGAILNKTLTSPRFLTNAGQAIQKSGVTTPIGFATKGAISAGITQSKKQ